MTNVLEFPFDRIRYPSPVEVLLTPPCTIRKFLLKRNDRHEERQRYLRALLFAVTAPPSESYVLFAPPGVWPQSHRAMDEVVMTTSGAGIDEF